MDISVDALIGIIGVIIGGVITWLTTRKKSGAEATKLITEAAANLIEPLSERISDLEKKTQEQDKLISGLTKSLDRYAKRVIYLMGGIEQLVRQVSKHEPPCWTPSEWTADEVRRIDA
jgi:uncharacterized coiled-coil protein SlyX